MSRIAYVNGRYTAHRGAQIHIEDRGLQFADGVYEVIAVVGGRMIDTERHFVRLNRSLGELQIAMPMSQPALTTVLDEVIRRNRVAEGIVYLQVNRGVAPRNHAFPAAVKPSVVVTARAARPATAAVLHEGVRVVSVPDQRWHRRDIKSVSLLPNVLAKQIAAEAGAFEAWQIDGDGYITEGSQSNAWMVDADGVIRTRAASNDILNGITRLRILELAQAAGLTVEQRAFTLDEAMTARETFLTGTSSFVVPIVQIDDTVIGNGQPGSITEQVRDLYLDYARQEAATPS